MLRSFASPADLLLADSRDPLLLLLPWVIEHLGPRRIHQSSQLVFILRQRFVGQFACDNHLGVRRILLSFLHQDSAK